MAILLPTQEWDDDTTHAIKEKKKLKIINISIN